MVAQSLLQSNSSSKSNGSSSRSAGTGGGTKEDAQPRQDISWYQYDKSVMRDILQRDSVYDVNSARMVRKEGQQESSNGGGGGEVTAAEIIHFGDQHSKMQSTRQNVH